ncbi:hypothetical protein ScPMuIL_007903 [Solemya velum]
MGDSEAKVHFHVVRFIHEAGMKLHLKSIPLSTASLIYHMFFQKNSLREFDPYLIATTALYLSGKTEEAHVKLRDVINVCYRTLHKTKPPLEMGELFWALRDSVSNCELFILRMLQFRVMLDHPHKYLLHYLKFIRDWFEPYKWDNLPITRTAWAILRDSYHGSVSLHYPAEHVAIAVLYLTFESLGVEPPHTNVCRSPWWKVFAEDVTLERIKSIIIEITKTYELEDSVS